MDKKKLSSNSLIYLIPVAFTILFILSWLWLAGIIPFSSDDNLLLGTNHGTGNYRLIDNGFDAYAVKSGSGIKVTTMAKYPDGWLVLFFNDNRSSSILSGPDGDSYKLSFEAKSNISGATIRASHRQGDGQQNQIDFGTAELSSAGTWESISLSGNLTGTPATTQGVYLSLKNNTPGTEIIIRNLKLTKTES